MLEMLDGRVKPGHGVNREIQPVSYHPGLRRMTC